MDAERGMATGPLEAGVPPERRATGGSEEPLSMADIVGGGGARLDCWEDAADLKKKGRFGGSREVGWLWSAGLIELPRAAVSWHEDRTHCATLHTPLCLNK